MTPVTQSAASPQPRPGGRTARIRTQVLAAVEAVAARAGVHRTTVYRRWRDVGCLIADVFAAASDLDWHPLAPVHCAPIPRN